MSFDPNKLKRLPEKNLEEAQRLLKNLEVRLKEIRQEAEAIQIAAVRKLLEDKQVEK